MYICMYLRMYACMYVYVYVCTYVCSQLSKLLIILHKYFCVFLLLLTSSCNNINFIKLNEN